ncbi:uncharacterized protein V2V93DRAFT_373235 [Kockiozyma suomiensis]|uniref:uncharacterized protein n=1 Tax=Kockiozyma suomiensis TaxID=1337062 RepID=UPI00334324C5
MSQSNARPRGILKNPPSPERYQQPPPPVDRELLLHNTEINAAQTGDRSNVVIKPLEKRPVPADPQIDRGHTSGTPLVHAPHTAADAEAARLKWDEANIYLTEQERTATMKITEPKTPYAGAVDPSDLLDYDDNDEIVGLTLSGINGERREVSEDIPELELGEAEVTSTDTTEPKEARIIADSTNQREEPTGKEGESAETESEEARHKRFGEMRKKHYEMKDALKIAEALAHKEEDEEKEE